MNLTSEKQYIKLKIINIGILVLTFGFIYTSIFFTYLGVVSSDEISKRSSIIFLGSPTCSLA
jgi:hypothetical protein